MRPKLTSQMVIQRIVNGAEDFQRRELDQVGVLVAWLGGDSIRAWVGLVSYGSVKATVDR
jgi:hypothetical protein